MSNGNNQVAVINEVRTAIDAMAPQFAKALPKHINVDKFVRVAQTAVQMNPDLLAADRRTLYAACTRAAQQGLLPDGREGAIVTYGNKAQWMPMVGGIMKLVRNSGEITTWSVQAVYERDSFDYQLGDDERIVHKPALSNRGNLVGVYSIVTMKGGEKSREFMSVDEVNAIRTRSRSGNGGPWKTDFAEMAKKTVVRRHSKRLPMSTDLDDLLRTDDELYMPAEKPVPVPPGPTVTTPGEDSRPHQPRRASRLQAVAEQAPVTIDEDGVIQDEVNPPAPVDAYDGPGDSPI